LKAGETGRLDIVIESNAPTAQYFGEITLTPRTRGLPTLHIPVAFVPQQGAVLLESSCDPASIPKNTTTTCTVTATNNGSTEAIVDLTSTGKGKLRVVDAAGATVKGGVATLSDVVLPG